MTIRPVSRSKSSNQTYDSLPASTPERSAFTSLRILRKIHQSLTHLGLRLQKSPVILTANLGRLFGPVGTCSIFLTVSIPSITRPKTTCFPSRKSHTDVVMKNWQPFVFGPEFAYGSISFSNTERMRSNKRKEVRRLMARI
jgi:hypothetical protein